MKTFLETNRYSIVKYALITLGSIAVHNLSHVVAVKVWKSTLPLFDDREMAVDD